ncbi:MAG: tail fiber domain-containing protein, partial [Patescibacteria group bacterium]
SQVGIGGDVTGGSAKLYVNGNVGIGTTGPGYKLDVSGTGNFTSTVTAPTFFGALSGNATTATTASNANLLDSLDSASFLRTDANNTFTGQLSVPTANRSGGIYGTYDSYKIGHIWSMGIAYKILDDGSTFNTLYGMAYCHTNNANCKAGYGHQIDITQNGVIGIALGMGGGAWFGSTVTAPTFSGALSGNATTATNLTGLTATVAELNILDGVTGVTAAELTNLGGVTATGAEINILDGVTGVTAAELTNLGGVTATAAEINALNSGTGANFDLTAYDGKVRMHSTVTVGTGIAQYNRGYVTSNLYFNGTNWITSTISGSASNEFSGIQFSNGGSLNLIAGSVATGTTNLGTSLNSYIRARVLSNGTMLVTSLGTGTVYSNAGSLTNTNPSDIRLKKNILNINDTLSKILNLRPVTFNWKSNEEPSIGFIAEEVEPIFPELVRTETDGYKGL